MKTNLRRGLLALMGFSAAPMLTACYGMPYQDELYYTPFSGISGMVVDSQTFQPIKGIKLSVKPNGVEQATYSDENGVFHLEGDFPRATYVYVEDVDGINNGEYNSTSMLVDAACCVDFTIPIHNKHQQK